MSPFASWIALAIMVAPIVLVLYLTRPGTATCEGVRGDGEASRHPSEVAASRAMHTCDRAGMTARRGDRPPR